MKKEYFPIFVSSNGKKVLVVGGGIVATRRIKTLVKFNFDITVISPNATEDILELHNAGALKYENTSWQMQDISQYYMVLACTNDEAVNKDISVAAGDATCFINISNSKDDSNFYFPGVHILNTDRDVDLVLGITSEGKDYALIKNVMDKIRGVFN